MIRKILFGLAVWIVLLGVSFLVGLALAVLGVPPLLCVAAFVATFAGLVWLLKESATIDRWFNEIG
jgi:apolipoprotein N-acyltransferase